ncbi:hypothetical protein B0H13DRAFT_2392933 [Mycena leptocephala]|nr:hypothetical protein B0H13DRAFT_2392933 [Mycena leptocephala]
MPASSFFTFTTSNPLASGCAIGSDSLVYALVLPLQVVVLQLQPWNCPLTCIWLVFHLFSYHLRSIFPLPAPRFPRDDDLRVWTAVNPMDSAEAHSRLPPLPLAMPQASPHPAFARDLSIFLYSIPRPLLPSFLSTDYLIRLSIIISPSKLVLTLFIGSYIPSALAPALPAPSPAAPKKTPRSAPSFPLRYADVGPHTLLFLRSGPKAGIAGPTTWGVRRAS